MGHSGNAWMISRAVHEVSHNTSDSEPSTQGRSIGDKRHQPKKKPSKIRRGEGGGEWMGGPLWSPARRGMQVARAGHRGTAGDHKGNKCRTHPPFIHPRPYG